MKRQLEIGMPLVFIDSKRRRLPALLQCVHGDLQFDENNEVTGYIPCINLIVISTDENRQDSYGRQIEHFTSVGHHSNQGTPVGNCWYWPDEKVVIDEANVATKR